MAFLPVKSKGCGCAGNVAVGGGDVAKFTG